MWVADMWVADMWVYMTSSANQSLCQQEGMRSGASKVTRLHSFFIADRG